MGDFVLLLKEENWAAVWDYFCHFGMAGTCGQCAGNLLSRMRLKSQVILSDALEDYIYIYICCEVCKYIAA